MRSIAVILILCLCGSINANPATGDLESLCGVLRCKRRAMQLDPGKHTEAHYWITLFWCALGGLILGGIVVISYWIRRCSEAAAPEPRSDELIISCRQQQPTQRESQRVITRSQSSKVSPDAASHPLKQQQSLPTPLHSAGEAHQHSHLNHHPHASKSVSILVYKTLNTVFKSSRKIIVRVCEVASAKKSFTMFKFNKAAQQQRIDNRNSNVTGHDQFVRPPVPEKKVRNIMKKLHKQNGLKRSNSAIEFDVSALSAANRRQIYSSNRSASSEQDNSDMSEHSEKSPLVSARLDNLARLFFSKSMPAESGSRDTIDSVLTTRPNIKYQYSALDSGNGIVERSPRERVQRERALNATQEWIQSANGRYEVIAHLDEIGSRHGKNWFLVNDASVRTDRLLTLLPLPADCVAFEDLPPSESARDILMELLGSLHHPYIYPVLDLGFLRNSTSSYACLVTPFNSRGSLKDLIYKAQWNEPWARKYTRKPNGLPVSQIQRLGRQILEALLFLKERGFPLHGHLHSGNVILQNGAARLSGLENGLLGLSSRINAVMWSRSVTDIENVDIVCFGHLLYEMCTGQEMTTPKPSMRVLEMELQHYPNIGQILEILGLIFEPPSGVCPSVEDLVLCDLFRSIDLRELRGPCFSTIKASLSRSTLNLLHAVKKRQCASLGNSCSETSSPCTPPSTPQDRRSGPRSISRTMDSFDISSDSEEGLLEEIVVGGGCHHHSLQRLQWQSQQGGFHSTSTSSFTRTQHKQHYEPTESPIHYCDHAAIHSDDNSQELRLKYNQPSLRCSTSSQSNLNVLLAEGPLGTIAGEDACDDRSCGNSPALQDELDEHAEEVEEEEYEVASGSSGQRTHVVSLHAPASTSAAASFNHQLTADMCSFKNSKSRRLEYSLKCLKYGRSNPSQDSAFGSLTDNDLSIGSSSFRLSSFQSISSPIDEGVEDVIIATTTAGNETCLELATIPRSMVSQDSAISSPCRESSPSNFLNIDDAMSGGSGSCSGGSTSSGSLGNLGNLRPQQFPVSLSPKILVTATSNSSNSSLASNSREGPSHSQSQSQTPAQQQQQFDPPKILVNDQNSIYTTSPSKRSSMIEVFSQKYRVSSFEDMSPGKQPRSSSSSSASDKHLKHVNRMAFRSLEEERRIDNAFLPIADRTHSDNRVNMQSEKYKKLTHASFRISKTASQGQVAASIYDSGGSPTAASNSGSIELQRPMSSSNRQTLWRDSKFYRKNRIAKSNDSLLETSPNHSARLSPCSMRDNHCESSCSSHGSRSQSRSHSRQSLNRGGSINEISGGSSQTLGLGLGLSVTTSFCGGGSASGRRYCSSKSEDLGESSDYLRVMDARKSYSERHLVSLVKLKQTAINNTNSGSDQFCPSEDEMSFNDDNNASSSSAASHGQQQQQQQQQQQLLQQLKRPQKYQQPSTAINHLKTTNIKTTSLATLSCQTNLANAPSAHPTATANSNSNSHTLGSKSKLEQALNLSTNHNNNNHSSKSSPNSSSTNGSGATEDNSSVDESPSKRTLSSAELSRIFVMDMDDAPGSSCSEEKTPLLDSVEMSPISPTEPDLDKV